MERQALQSENSKSLNITGLTISSINSLASSIPEGIAMTFIFLLSMSFSFFMFLPSFPIDLEISFLGTQNIIISLYLKQNLVVT